MVKEEEEEKRFLHKRARRIILPWDLGLLAIYASAVEAWFAVTEASSGECHEEEKAAEKNETEVEKRGTRRS